MKKLGLATAMTILALMPMRTSHAEGFRGEICAPAQSANGGPWGLAGPWGAAPGISIFHNMYGVIVGAATEGTLTQSFWCPLPESRQNITSINLGYYDRHPTVDVTCTAYVMDDGGNVVYTKTLSSSGAQSFLQSLNWTVSPVQAHGVVACTVPQNVLALGLNGYSGLNGFWVGN